MFGRLPMAPEDTSFAQLVSLACHDLRTPLATIYGFSRTLTRMTELGETATNYLGIVEASSRQLAELLDELSLAARIQGQRYDPERRAVDTLELATTARERLGEERVEIAGPGGPVLVDVDATPRAVSALAQCALRHGGLERVTVTADGAEIRIAPITPASAPVVLGRELRDLGAAVAVRVIEAPGGTVTLDGDTLVVRFPV
jgi:signal transduction histidine kinase